MLGLVTGKLEETRRGWRWGREDELTASFLREGVEGPARSGLGKRRAVPGKPLTSRSLPKVTDV